MGEILHGLDALKAWKEKNDSKEGNQKDTQEKSPAPEKPAFDAKLATAPYNFIPLPTGVLPSPLDKYRDVFMGDSQERTQEAFAEYMAHTETRDGYIELTIRTMTPVFIGGDVKSFAPTGEPIIPGSTLRGMTKNLVKIVTLGAMRAEEDFHDRHLYFRCIMTTGKSEPWENDLKALYDAQMAEGKTRKTKPGFLVQTKNGYYIYPMLKNPERVLIREYEKAFGKTIGRDMKDVRVEWEGATAYAISGCKSPKAKGHALFETKNEYDVFMTSASESDKKNIGKQFVLKYPLADVDWNDNHRIHVSDDVVAEYRDDKNRRGVNLLNLRREDSKGGAIDKETLKHLMPNAPQEIEKISPCYYLPDEANGAKSFGHGRHFRIAYERSIGDAVPNMDSPVIDFADALFGANLSQKKQSGRRWKPLWASRVFFEDAHAVGDVKTAEKSERTHPLVGPNPTSFQLYLRQEDKKPLVNWDNPDAVIRGYKLYWHRPDANWKANGDELAQDKEKGKDGKLHFKSPEKQMTHEITPLAKNNIFTSRIRFRSLSDIELGALLTVFHPNNTNGSASGLTCKLGHAKSLGLGSVYITAKLFVEAPPDYACLFGENGWNEPAKETDDQPYMNVFNNYVKTEWPDMDGEQRHIRNILGKMLDWENTKTYPDWNERTAPMSGNVKTDNVDSRYVNRARLPEVNELVKNPKKPKKPKEKKSKP